MKIIKHALDGLIEIQPDVYNDNRGYFFDNFCAKAYEAVFGRRLNFVQTSTAYNACKNTFRGIHFQLYPYAQAKLVQCTSGSALDIVVDLRLNSPTYKKYVCIKVSAVEKNILYIPVGFGHAYLTLEDNTSIMYMMSNDYCFESSRTLSFLDPDINLKLTTDVKNMIISEKDKNGMLLKDLEKDLAMLKE